jgi:hypothetical protein
MKTSHPYGMGMTVKMTPETVSSQLSKASGKAKARYPNPPLGPSQDNPTAGKMKRPAYTPGGTPSGA